MAWVAETVLRWSVEETSGWRKPLETVLENARILRSEMRARGSEMKGWVEVKGWMAAGELLERLAELSPSHRAEVLGGRRAASVLMSRLRALAKRNSRSPLRFRIRKERES